MTDVVWKSLMLGLAAAAVMLLATGRRAAPVPGPPGVAVVDVGRAAAGDHLLDVLGLA